MKYDKNNCEIPDPTPIEVPIGYSHPETLQDMIARFCAATDFRKQLEAQGADTIEEAEDLDISDEVDLVSEHELIPMIDEFPEERIVPDKEPASAPTPAPVPETKVAST